MILKIRSIVVKEIRENLPWGGLIFLITAGLLIVGLTTQTATGISLMGSTVLMFCLLMYPAAGFALGMVQVLQDSRKGRWQFISHRSMSRSVMLGCKVVVGIALYLAATIVPLILVARWLSVPGHVAGPFSWDMIEPGLAGIFNGLIWYAMGVLIAVRNARWIGSRLIPVGGAFAGSFLYYLYAWTLPQAIGITLGVAALVMLSAFGVYRSNGQSSRTPIWGKPWIGISLLCGWIILLSIGMQLGDAAFRMVVPIRNQNAQYRMYHLGEDGQLHVWTLDKGKVVKDQDPSGKQLSSAHGDPWTNDAQTAITLYFPRDYAANKMIYPAYRQGFLDPDSHVILLRGGSPSWYYVPSRRTVEAYDPQFRAYIGSLGPNGFVGPDRPAQRFPQAMQTHSAFQNQDSLLTGANAVYETDLSQNRITRIFNTTDADPVLTAGTTPYYLRQNATTPDQIFTVITTKSSLHILQDDRLIATIPIDYSHLQNAVTIGHGPKGTFVVIYGMDYPIGLVPLEVCTYGADSKLISRAIYPADLKPLDVSPDFEEIGVLTLSPPAFFAVVFTMKSQFMNAPWHVFLFISIPAVGFAGIALAMLRARHAARRQLYLWLPLTACLGLSGIALLMSMLESPKSVRCPACGKRRLVTEAQCPNCQAPAEVPRMEGIEIFESTLITGARLAH